MVVAVLCLVPCLLREDLDLFLILESYVCSMTNLDKDEELRLLVDVSPSTGS